MFIKDFIGYILKPDPINTLVIRKKGTEYLNTWLTEMCLWLTAVKTKRELCIPQNAHFAFQIFWTTEIVLGGRRNGGVSPCCWTGLFWLFMALGRWKVDVHKNQTEVCPWSSAPDGGTVEASLSTWGQSNWAVRTMLWSWTLWDYSASGKNVEISKNYLQKFASIKAENTHCAFKDDLSSPRGKITPFNPI